MVHFSVIVKEAMKEPLYQAACRYEWQLLGFDGTSNEADNTNENALH